MELFIDRKWKKDAYTIGDFYVDGVWFCNSLEDRDRGICQGDTLSRIKYMKVFGETAIPTGRYRVVMTKSPKFGRVLPEVLDVPGFTGIRIHNGSYPKDTEGCPLVGRNTAKGMLTDSRVTTERLCNLINQAIGSGQEVWLTVM